MFFLDKKWQECVVYTPIDRGINQYPEGYYCADVCDPSPCDADETCQLVPSPCIGAYGALCPPVAECSPSMTDECDTCHEFQVIKNVMRGKGIVVMAGI